MSELLIKDLLLACLAIFGVACIGCVVYVTAIALDLGFEGADDDKEDSV